jgi:hypothetical protein
VVRGHGHLRLIKVGTLTRARLRAGAVKVPFSGRLGRKRLPQGSYRVTAIATGAGGLASKPAVASFQVAG